MEAINDPPLAMHHLWTSTTTEAQSFASPVASVTMAPHPPAVAPSPSLGEIAEVFNPLLIGCDDIESLLSKTARLLVEQFDCVAAWVCTPDSNGQYTQIRSLTESGNVVWQVVEDPCKRLIAPFAEPDKKSSLCTESSNLTVAVSPVYSNSTPEPECLLIACRQTHGRPATRQASIHLPDLIWLAAQSLGRWFQLRTLHQLDAERRNSAGLLTLQHQLNQVDHPNQAARTVANHIRNLLQLQQVFLTLDGQLVAVSDVEQIDRQNETVQKIESVMNRMSANDQPVFYSPNDGPNCESDSKATQLNPICKILNTTSCVLAPLIADPETQARRLGNVLLAGPSERINHPAFANQLESVLKRVAPQLNVALKANRRLTGLCADQFSRLRRAKWSQWIVALICATAGLLAVPVPYRIKCDCEMQPVSRRFVTAPFESILEQTFVKNGDVVSQNQLLARLDGRQIRIELAGLQAEYAGAKKKYDAELAAKNVAHSQIARSEMDRLSAKIELLEERIAHLDIKSPLAGQIVAGDLEKAEGASLTIGQTLFEIAPLEKMVAEIAIPESEIQYARENHEITIKLESFPFRSWQGVIESIHPRAEMIDMKNVFIAQANFENEEGLLRPGMKGKGKIKSEWEPLGWCLFHCPWETVRYWTVW